MKSDQAQLTRQLNLLIGELVKTVELLQKAARQPIPGVEPHRQPSSPQGADNTPNEAVNPTGTPSLKELSDAVITLANKQGRSAALSVLEQFGVGRVPDLSPAQYPAALTAVTKALEGR